MVCVKKEFETDPRFGGNPEEREVSELLETGVVVLDKPCGPSSHEVSAWVKGIIGAQKTGHSGTLDPRVSGILPVGINRSTRVIPRLSRANKEYVCVIRFHKSIPEARMEQAMMKFVGEITQTPPIRSAVARRPRKRKVYYLDIIEFNPPEVLFTVGCQAGTYIRKLCADIGKLAGCGAHMVELRRTKAGLFEEKDLFLLQDLSDAYWLWKEKGNEREIRRCVLPFEKAIPDRKIWVSDQTVEALCSGAPLAAPGISKLEEGFAKGEDVAVLTLKNELISFGKALMGWEKALSSDKGLVTSTDRVVMKKGIYPRCW